MVIQRGEIWWADLPEPAGSEPGYHRPVVVAVTSNLNLAQMPGNVLLLKKVTGLPKDSVANVSQIFTVDRVFLTEKIGDLPVYLLEQVEAGLRMVMDLG